MRYSYHTQLISNIIRSFPRRNQRKNDEISHEVNTPKEKTWKPGINMDSLIGF
jgi:hypothetical protein